MIQSQNASVDPNTCYYLYRIDRCARKLFTSKYRIMQAFGGFAINFIMGFCYATVMQAGEREYKRRNRKHGRNKKVS